MGGSRLRAARTGKRVRKMCDPEGKMHLYINLRLQMMCQHDQSATFNQ